MKFPDDFVNQYKKFLVHKNLTGEKVPNLENQLSDFKSAVDYVNSTLKDKSISELTAEELFNMLVETHTLAAPNLYKTLPKSRVIESPGDFRLDSSLELKRPPNWNKYYQGMGTDQTEGMARFLRDHYPKNDPDIGLEFLSGYYKIIWSQDFDEAQRAVYKRRATMNYLTRGMSQAEALAFQIKYGPLAKQPNPPEVWQKPYLMISEKLDAPVTPQEKLALDKIFWVRDCDNLKEKTLKFAAELIEAIKKGTDPIETFARFAYRFIHIHPFQNGNSRVMQIVLNIILVEANLPPIFLGNIFSTREELYENYFHPKDEESIIPSFVETLRKAIELAQKEKQLNKKTLATELGNVEWKVYPKDKLQQKYIGHQVRFFTFKENNKQHANKALEELKKDGFAAEMRAMPNRDSFIIVDLTSSLQPKH
jgi:hypothetical protein